MTGEEKRNPAAAAKRAEESPREVGWEDGKNTRLRRKETKGKERLDERTAKKGRKKRREPEQTEKKYKNTLDRKMAFARYSHRASNCLPP